MALDLQIVLCACFTHELPFRHVLLSSRTQYTHKCTKWKKEHKFCTCWTTPEHICLFQRWENQAPATGPVVVLLCNKSVYRFLSAHCEKKKKKSLAYGTPVNVWQNQKQSKENSCKTAVAVYHKNFTLYTKCTTFLRTEFNKLVQKEPPPQIKQPIFTTMSGDLPPYHWNY